MPDDRWLRIRRSELPRPPGIARNREAHGGPGMADISRWILEGAGSAAPGAGRAEAEACGIQDASGNEKTRTNRVKKVKKSQGN